MPKDMRGADQFGSLGTTIAWLHTCMLVHNCGHCLYLVDTLKRGLKSFTNSGEKPFCSTVEPVSETPPHWPQKCGLSRQVVSGNKLY